MADDSDARVDALYDLSLGEFVEARNALAKELSKSGDKTKSAEVKALAKPSSSAFALNRVVRRHGVEVGAFLRASDRMARAQLRAMSGSGSDADFRAAVNEQRDALERLLQLAAPILEEAGQSAKRPVLEKIARTLRAIVLDEGERSRFERGRLSADLLDQGFDALAAALGGALPPPSHLSLVPDVAPEASSVVSKADARAERMKAAREQAARGKAELKKTRVEAARKALREAERLVAVAREKVESAREEMTKAEQVVAETRRVLVNAERSVAQKKETFQERSAELRELEVGAEKARAALLEVDAPAPSDDDDDS